MANPKGTPNTFDSWLKTVVQPNVATNSSKTVKAPAKKQPTGGSTGPTAGQNDAAAQQSQSAFLSATESAGNLHQALAQFKTGAISKNQVEQSYNDYQTKLKSLSTLDPSKASSIDSGFHTPVGPPPSKPAQTNVPQGNPIGPGLGVNKAKDDAARLAAPITTTTPVNPPTGGSGGTGSASGTGSTSGTSGTGSGAKVADTPLSRQGYLDNFIANNPNGWAIIKSDPGLTKVFAEALQKGYSPEKFKQLYENSSYYVNHQGSWLDSAGARLGNGKGKWVETYNNALGEARQLAISQGLNIDPANFGITPDNPTGKLKIVNGQIVGLENNKPFVYDSKNPNLTSWVLDHYYNSGVGANATAITNYFATRNKIDPAHMSGVFGQNVDQLKSWANDLGMNSLVLKGNTNYFSDAANSIASGKQNLEYFHQDLMNQSAASYPIYANQIKAGLSVRSIASPYLNTISSLLETTPDNMDISSPTGDGAMVRRALQGNGIDKPMSLTDFATQVRQDPRWGKTLNAQNSVESISHKVLSDFGLVD